MSFHGGALGRDHRASPGSAGATASRRSASATASRCAPRSGSASAASPISSMASSGAGRRRTGCPGHDLPDRRAGSAPPQPALSGDAGGLVLFVVMLALSRRRAAPGALRLPDRRVPGRLRHRAHHRRVLPPAGRLPRLPLRRGDHGPVAVLPMLLVGGWLMLRRLAQACMTPNGLTTSWPAPTPPITPRATRSPISPPRRRSARCSANPRALGGGRLGARWAGPTRCCWPRPGRAAAR